MYDVFLSYSRADSAIAEEIYRKLTEKGLKVFYDKASIGAESFPQKIAQGIKSSKVFLFLASCNSVMANYAPDELVFAKNNKSRNSIIIYNIDSCSLPDDIDLLFSSLNRRNAQSDPLSVVIDDILQILAQGVVSNVPRVSKGRDIDDSFRKLYEEFLNFEYYSIIHWEMANELWKSNWNHHLLLMKAFERVGDSGNYRTLLQLYQSSGITYYPKFYNLISQIWDMIKMGCIKESTTHVNNLSREIKSDIDKICSDVNYSHILLLTGHHQEALNNYREILKRLNRQQQHQYLLKDFDTIRWLGYNQLSNPVISKISSLLGYKGKNYFTTLEGCGSCQQYEDLLATHRWHWRDGRLHVVVSFKKFRGNGNSIYYLELRDKSILGMMFDVLPFGLDETDSIQHAERIFCQYRMSFVNGQLMLEEYNPVTEQIFSGEIIRLNKKELHIRILDNGDPKSRGKIRKYKAIQD